jgi:hypothetical protein
MAHTFEDLVRQRAHEKTGAIDWEERKTWWQNQMRSLLDDVTGWLRPLIDDHSIELIRKKTDYSEQYLGSYEIDCALIKLGSEIISLNPSGSVIIGGFGRVDAKGPNGTVLLILTNLDDDVPQNERRKSATWFYAHPKRRSNLLPLTKHSFEKIVSDLFSLER